MVSPKEILKTIPAKVLDEWKKLIIESFHFTCETLEKHKIKYWIDMGSLLGACRGGGHIWMPEIGNIDDDAEVSILMKDRKRVLEIFEKATKNSEWEFRHSGNSRRPHYELQIFKKGMNKRILKCQTDIIIYTFRPHDKTIYSPCPTPTALPIPVQKIFPLSNIMFEGKIVKCPKNPREFVESKYKYGKNAIKNPKYSNTQNKKKLPYTILNAYKKGKWK